MERETNQIISARFKEVLRNSNYSTDPSERLRFCDFPRKIWRKKCEAKTTSKNRPMGEWHNWVRSPLSLSSK